MKVLIVSEEVWRDDTNGGNVLSNIFSGLDLEIAQIYCSGGIPQNALCGNYYQMTDGMILKNLVRHAPVGRVIHCGDCAEKNGQSEADGQRLAGYHFFHRFNFPIFYAAQEAAWKTADWKTQKLDDFIIEFQPDLIFAPCYAKCYMQELDRYVYRIAKVPMISYISDDGYSLRQFSLAPSYWIRRFLVRKNMRATFQLYKLVYTMTSEQKAELEKALGANMKILCKGIDVERLPVKTGVNSPIRMIYAGGIYLNRWKVLAEVVEAIKALDHGKSLFRLDIYTSDELDEKRRSALEVDGVSSVHKAVPFPELKEIYSRSDIALHVESMDLKNRLATRLSFSTKIVDCLSSGCAVMAIAWDQQAGFRYLKENDAAICIDDVGNIKQTLEYIYTGIRSCSLAIRERRECVAPNIMIKRRMIR